MPIDRFTMAGFLLFLFLALATSNIRTNNHPAAAAAGEVIIVDLQGNGSEEAALAVQSHDLSMAGFTNGSGHWHAFAGHEHVIPGSTPLPFGNSYGDLIGGLANLPGVPLGRAAALQAVRVLSAHDPLTAGGDLEPLKRALAAQMVMVCEAARLKPVFETVSGWWESGARVAPEHLPYIRHWDAISFEIIRAQRTGKWAGGPFTKMLERSANIRTLEEALAVVRVLVDRDFGQVLKAHAVEIS